MAKHTLKILLCEHRKIFKYVWPFYNIMHEWVKRKQPLKFVLRKGASNIQVRSFILILKNFIVILLILLLLSNYQLPFNETTF